MTIMGLGITYATPNGEKYRQKWTEGRTSHADQLIVIVDELRNAKDKYLGL
jgi:hypothetical protein